MMNRMLKTGTVAMAMGALLMTVSCKKEGVVEESAAPPAPRTAVPVPESIPVEGDPSIQPAPIRQVLDEEVGARWKAVEITVTEKKEGGAVFTAEIPLQGESMVEGTPLNVKVLGFVPDFSMGADTITTKSLDDNNPAAKIEVTEGEETLFTGWSFRDFPGMHSFDDPRYTVQLSRAIPAE